MGYDLSRDIVTGRLATPSATLQGVTYDAGNKFGSLRAADFPEGNDSALEGYDTGIYLSDEMADWGSYSLYVWLQHHIDTFADHGIIGHRTDGNRGMAWYIRDTWRSPAIVHQSVAEIGSTTDSGSAAYVKRGTNEFFLLGVEWDGSDVYHYQQAGVSRGSGAMSSINDSLEALTATIGVRNGSTKVYGMENYRMHSLVAFDRRLSAEERSYLFNNPWAMYAAPRTYSIIPTGAGGPAATPNAYRPLLGLNVGA